MADIALNLKKTRLECGKTQEWLANKLGVSQTAIALWERGTRLPPISTIENIAKILNVSPSQLIGWESKEKNSETENGIETLIYELEQASQTQEKRSVLVRELENLLNGTILNETQDTYLHFDSKEYSIEELEEIKRFAEFVKSKRKIEK